MKKPILIANWKMSLGFKETLDLTSGLSRTLKDADFEKTDVVVCPSHLMLNSVAEILKDSKIAFGAQDCFWEEYGSFTSSVCPATLKEVGCKYVILGHSERRKFQLETDQMVHKKLRQAIDKKIIPIVCVGESLEERRNFRSDQTVLGQINEAFSGIEITNEKVVVAYEPVWAIGNQAVESGEAEYMIKVIKHQLYDMFDKKTVDENFKFLYGGSLNPENISEFVSRENIDGGLIGGKSLKVETFVEMIKNSVLI